MEHLYFHLLISSKNHYQTKLKELQRKNALKQKPTQNINSNQPPKQPPAHPPSQPNGQIPPSQLPPPSSIPLPSSIPHSSPPKKNTDLEKYEKIRQLEAELTRKNDEIRVLNYRLADRGNIYFLIFIYIIILKMFILIFIY
jgi:hypothetical protein